MKANGKIRLFFEEKNKKINVFFAFLWHTKSIGSWRQLKSTFDKRIFLGKEYIDVLVHKSH